MISAETIRKRTLDSIQRLMTEARVRVQKEIDEAARNGLFICNIECDRISHDTLSTIESELRGVGFLVRRVDNGCDFYLQVTWGKK